MDLKKKAMLEALHKTLGVITPACKSVGIARQTHYDWINNDPEYKKAVQELPEIALDFVEAQNYKQIKEGNTAAIIFYLKTKGKSRGYVERTETVNRNINEGLDTSHLTDKQLDEYIKYTEGLLKVNKGQDATED